MNSIIDYFEKTVKSYPKKTALIYKDHYVKINGIKLFRKKISCWNFYGKFI